MVAEKGRGATLNVASHRFNIAEQIADGDWLGDYPLCIRKKLRYTMRHEQEAPDHRAVLQAVPR